MVKQNEFDEKIHELEEALVERRSALGRSRTSEAEDEKLLALQKRTETLCEDARKPCDQDRKLEIIRLANELLLELRQNPIA